MELRYLFKKTQSAQNGDTPKNEDQGPQTPQGLFHTCTKCGDTIFSEELKRNLFVCPQCGGYFRMYAGTRIDSILDDGSFEEWDSDIKELNPLGTPGYDDKLAKLRDKTSLDNILSFLKSRGAMLNDLQITRSTSGENHNACAIASIRLKRRSNSYELLRELRETEGILLADEL